MNPNRPPRPVLMPHPRHRLLRVSQRTLAKPANSVIEPWVNIAADIAAINRGESRRHGETYTVNGRTYGVKGNGQAYPIDGRGIHPLNREAFKALGIYNQFGLSERAEEILDRRGTASADRAEARDAWQVGRQEEQR